MITVDRFGNAVTNLLALRGGHGARWTGCRCALRRTYADAAAGEPWRSWARAGWSRSRCATGAPRSGWGSSAAAAWCCCRRGDGGASTPPCRNVPALLASTDVPGAARVRDDAAEVDRALRRIDRAGAVMQLRGELAAGEEHEHRVVHPRQQHDHAADRAVRLVVRAEVLDVQAEEQRRDDPEHRGDRRGDEDVRPLLLHVGQQLEDERAERDEQRDREDDLEHRPRRDRRVAEPRASSRPTARHARHRGR